MKQFYKTGSFPIALILCLSIFLLFYRLSSLMMFIGDQGFFYLSARDMLLTGNIPLVGITSSHTWLHQGALWTYMLAPVLWVTGFNPVAGAYLTATIGVLGVWLMYKIGTELFSQRIGIIAALFYATSPLTVFFARMPYHTSPIPILTALLFYFMYRWVSGYQYGLPIIVFLFALLYNFELATFPLVSIFFVLLAYGIVSKADYLSDFRNKRIMIITLFAFLIPMIPMIVYDTQHGYPQTVKFVIWLGYKIATVFGYPELHPDAPGETYQTMLPFISILIQRMIFLPNAVIAWIILGISVLNLLFINRQLLQKKKYLQPYSLLFLFFAVPAVGYIVAKTNSDAYVIVFFPIIAFMIAFLFDRFFEYRHLTLPGIVLLLFFVGSNIWMLFQTNFLMGKNGYGLTFAQRMDIAQKIIQDANGRAYTIIAIGPGSQYETYLMGYEYLTWWLGQAPSRQKQQVQFVLQETLAQSSLEKKEGKK